MRPSLIRTAAALDGGPPVPSTTVQPMSTRSAGRVHDGSLDVVAVVGAGGGGGDVALGEVAADGVGVALGGVAVAAAAGGEQADAVAGAHREAFGADRAFAVGAGEGDHRVRCR